MILMGETKEEASDEDASDIHNNEIVSYFKPEHQNTVQNTTYKTMLHRQEQE